LKSLLLIAGALALGLLTALPATARPAPGAGACAPGASPLRVDGNLLLNPGGEANRAALAGIVRPKRWTTKGPVRLFAYNRDNRSDCVESDRIFGGNNYFTAERTGASMTQRVNVVGQRAEIDAGRRKALLTARFHDDGTTKRRTSVSLRYLDAGAKQIGQVRLVSRKGTGDQFELRTIDRAVPKGTRFLEVVVVFGNPQDKAAVDNISVSVGPKWPATGGYRLQRVADDANVGSMLLFQVIPDAPDQAVVGTRFGQLYRVSLDGSGERKFFGDVGSLLVGGLDSEEGLLGMAFSPNYRNDRQIYLYITAPPTGQRSESQLLRFKVRNNRLDLGSKQILVRWDQPYANHNGGAIFFDNEGLLYWGLGDGGAGGDPHGNGQKLSTLLGKVLRIDVVGVPRYRVPRDNPFVGRNGARSEIFAYGLRNPFRGGVDPETNDIWFGDVGQNRFEELDRVQPGKNYGWNRMEGFACYIPASNCNDGSLVLPRTAYGRGDGCSVIGGPVARASSLPELNGWVIYGDWCTGKLWAVKAKGKTNPVLLANTGTQITSFGTLPNGDTVLTTFNNAVYRIVRG